MREITAGYGTEIGKSGFIRADYIHRDWRDFYAASVTTSTISSTVIEYNSPVPPAATSPQKG